MRYLRVILAGIAGLAIGWIGAAALTILCGNLVGIVDRDGGYAMMAFFAIGPVGGIAGFIAAIWLLGHFTGRKGARAFLARSLVAAMGIAAIAAATGAAFWMMRPGTVTNGLPPELVFEIRMPRGAVPPPLVSRDEALARRSPIELATGHDTMSATVDELREDSGRPLVIGRVEMYFRDRNRLLVLKRDDGDIVFEIDLPSDPEHSDSFGEWQRPVLVDGAAAEQASEGYEIRYRAAWPGYE